MEWLQTKKTDADKKLTNHLISSTKLIKNLVKDV